MFFEIKMGDLHDSTLYIIVLLTNDAMLQRMSENVYESAKDYGYPKVWKKWRNAIGVK
ncbi:hypothetical protein [Lentilactobacillus diolivorans]|uniref:Uncharacterized protein n=1 Tax=Lentilactobacillus diolivorans TaxID=179838 RepID=A0ABQ0XGU8_9LACO|nr:hypothetical protein [Lentilactobacillus diolivorans]GEP25286.1 hypothetical protein LDI01_28790 [Lentilactobacillus diolivorans]